MKNKWKKASIQDDPRPLKATGPEPIAVKLGFEIIVFSDWVTAVGV